MAAVAYDPNDKAQASFLAALGLGEVGQASGYTTGVGGTDTSGSATDAYGFPIWSGTGNSHAAGEFQFQPSTWDTIASQYGLNFSNPSDQNAGAWYLAEQTYAAKTGNDLEIDLKAGNYSQVQTALAGVWPSVTGNASAPNGLTGTLTSGIGGTLMGGANAISADTSGGLGSLFNGGGVIGNIGAFIADEFTRFGVLIVGALIVLVALWYILSQTTGVPSPGETAKAAGTALALAA